MWYRIDAVDRIAEVSSDWAITAQRSGAPELRPATVIGRPIWSFIDGHATNFHYAQLFETVRQTKAPMQTRIRADSPSRQSLMRIEILPDENQSLKIVTQTIRDRAIGYVGVWDRNRPRSANLVVACSWCKAIEMGAQWLPFLDACQKRRDLLSTCPPQVVHHICPGCERAMIQERDAAFAAPIPSVQRVSIPQNHK